MEPWLQNVKQTLGTYLHQNPTYLVAVSGGLDSTVLCHVLHRTGYRFAIAHINYNLRGADAVGDAAFVKDLAQQLQVAFHEKVVSPSEHPSQGVQQWARDIRYSFFRECMDSKGYPLLLLGHHQDDQTEQFFLKAMRPSGVFSLGGMKTLDGNRLRPLLQAKKAELQAWAVENGVDWREDASNQKTQYNRNWWRKEGIPFIEKQYPDAGQRISALQTDLQGAEAGVEGLLTWALAQLGKSLAYGVFQLQLEAWKRKLNQPTLALWLQPKGFSSAIYEAIWALPNDGESKFFKGTLNYDIEIKSGQLYLIDRAFPQRLPKIYHSVEEVQQDYDTVEVHHPQEVQHLQENQFVLPNNPSFFPLEVRPVKPEDYMQPLGMQQHKKLEDLFKNAKVPYCLRKNLFTWQTKLGVLYLEGIRSAELSRWSGQTKKHYIISIH